MHVFFRFQSLDNDTINVGETATLKIRIFNRFPDPLSNGRMTIHGLGVTAIRTIS